MARTDLEINSCLGTIGLGRARRLLLTGETVNAQEALTMGLVDQVVPADSLAAVAEEVASQFLSMSRDVLTSQKKIVTNWLNLRCTRAYPRQ